MLSSFARRLARSLYTRLPSAFSSRAVIREINGIRYELDLSEMIDSALYFCGCYEPETSRALSRYLRPDMTVIEVGANIGAHTFEIAQQLDPRQGKLYSFEPTVYAFEKLQRNFQLNDFRHVVLEKVALSDTNEQRDIHRATSPETMPFKASWNRSKRDPKTNSIDRITFRRLDDYIAEQGIQRLDLLKVDVDGYEMCVLRGGLETLRRFHPLLIIEVGTTLERVGDRPDALIDTLTELGYEFRAIETEAPLDRDELLDEVKRRRTLDCLCLPSSASTSQPTTVRARSAA